VTAPFDAHHASRRPLYRDQAGREGLEAELVSRLTAGLEPEAARRTLVRALDGERSPVVTLVCLLEACGTVTAVRELVDEITARADEDSRAGDSLVRDRADELTRLFVEHEAGCAVVADLLRARAMTAAEVDDPLGDADELVSAWARHFDAAVARSEEASVAPHSLGSAALLERATAEVVALLDGWGLLAADRRVLQIGCGVGRFERALAPRVAEAHGADVSAGMLRAAERRCAGLRNVRLTRTSGRDLRAWGDASVDLVYAVGTFPYVTLRGALAAAYVAEAARVLTPGGALVICGWSLRDDAQADAAELQRLAEAHGLATLAAGERRLSLSDGAVWRMEKRG
jgi:SAM-dependent methyltransferase